MNDENCNLGWIVPNGICVLILGLLLSVTIPALAAPKAFLPGEQVAMNLDGRRGEVDRCQKHFAYVRFWNAGKGYVVTRIPITSLRRVRH